MNESWQRDDYVISTDKEKLDMNAIFDFLSQTYWAKQRNVATVKKTLENSLCFGVYQNNKQIGFARVVSDYAVTSYLFDVYILSAYQSMGLGKWLIDVIVNHPLIKDTVMCLATKDKHDFYQQFGFKLHENPERIMVLMR